METDTETEMELGLELELEMELAALEQDPGLSPDLEMGRVPT